MSHINNVQLSVESSSFTIWVTHLDNIAHKLKLTFVSKHIIRECEQAANRTQYLPRLEVRDIIARAAPPYETNCKKLILFTREFGSATNISKPPAIYLARDR